MNIRQLSNKFSENGSLIKSNIKNSSIKLLDKKKIIKEFEKKGAVLFRGYNFDKKNLWKFVKQFTLQFSNDAQRRDVKFNNKNIRGVDPGNQEIKIHSESSFNSACPEIIWFFCNKKPSNRLDGRTTICDGVRIWEELSYSSKKFFLSNPIYYKLKINIDLESKDMKKREWYLNSIGAINPVLNPKNKSIDYGQIAFAVNETRVPGQLSFCNHLLIDLKYEPQIIARTINKKKYLPKSISKELSKIIKKNIYKINWKNGDLIMLDNKRFMHGRESFKKNSIREVINIQSKYATFGYGNSTRNK